MSHWPDGLRKIAGMNRRPPRTGQHAGLFFQLFAPPDATGLPLVLLPGLLADGRQLARLSRLLSRQVCVVDPLGSGRSEAPDAPSEYAFPVQSERLSVLLDELGLPVVDLAGFSMGGMWAQHALVRHPQRFRHAALVATTAATSPRLRCIVQGLLAAHQAGVSQLDLSRTLQVMCFSADFLDPPSIIPMMEALWQGQPHAPAAVQGQLGSLLGHDLRAQLPTLPQIRAVIAGAEDFLMPPLTQKRLVELLPHAQLQLLPSAGHAVWVECPGTLATALRHALPVCL